MIFIETSSKIIINHTNFWVLPQKCFNSRTFQVFDENSILVQIWNRNLSYLEQLQIWKKSCRFPFKSDVHFRQSSDVIPSFEVMMPKKCYTIFYQIRSRYLENFEQKSEPNLCKIVKRPPFPKVESYFLKTFGT